MKKVTLILMLGLFYACAGKPTTKIRYSYDTFGNLKTVTLPTGAVTRYEYNAADKPHIRRTPKAGAICYEYDQQGRLIKTILPDKRRVDFVFKAR